MRPDKNIQKLVLSSVVPFVGELELQDFLITHAWPSGSIRRSGLMSGGAIGRHTFVASFRTEDPKEAEGLVIPKWDHVGNYLAAAMSVLFGKCFENHGMLENSGYFECPSVDFFGSFKDNRLAISSEEPRADFGIPLNLTEARRIMPLFFGQFDKSVSDNFFHASKFYWQALLNFHNDPEMSFLHFVTVGEVLSSQLDIDTDDLIEEEVRAAFARIASDLEGGAEIVRLLKGRMRQIKKRYIALFHEFVDENFFDRTESKHEFGRFSQENFWQGISSAYDLRSKYVHSGADFGRWIDSVGMRTEMPVGKPVVSDPDYAKTLFRSPTLIGLERATRYCLLRYAQKNGLDLELDIPSPSVEG